MYPSYSNFMAFVQLLVLFLVCLSSSCSAQSVVLTPSGEYCNNQTIINTVSLVSVNIDIVLTKLVATTPINGYSIATAGGNAGVDKVYGLAQCRGDVNSTDCFLCIQDAAKHIKQLCPNQADSRIWYDTCFLRYDTSDFLGHVDTSFGIFVYNDNNVTEQAKIFNRKFKSLMNKVVSKAVVPLNKGFGTGKTKLSKSDTLYALVQCTRDLSPLSCSRCLTTAVSDFATVCSNKQGCQLLYTSCYARYELNPFFSPHKLQYKSINFTNP